jgi:hypothetical protein
MKWAFFGVDELGVLQDDGEYSPNLIVCYYTSCFHSADDNKIMKTLGHKDVELLFCGCYCILDYNPKARLYRAFMNPMLLLGFRLAILCGLAALFCHGVL